MTNLVTRFANDESGATAIEYALIAAIMGVGIVAALTGLKGNVNAALAKAGTDLAANAK